MADGSGEEAIQAPPALKAAAVGYAEASRPSYTSTFQQARRTSEAAQMWPLSRAAVSPRFPGLIQRCLRRPQYRAAAAGPCKGTPGL